jgi:hypothetical protein
MSLSGTAGGTQIEGPCGGEAARPAALRLGSTASPGGATNAVTADDTHAVQARWVSPGDAVRCASARQATLTLRRRGG